MNHIPSANKSNPEPNQPSPRVSPLPQNPQALVSHRHTAHPHTTDTQCPRILTHQPRALVGIWAGQEESAERQNHGDRHAHDDYPASAPEQASSFIMHRRSPLSPPHQRTPPHSHTPRRPMAASAVGCRLPPSRSSGSPLPSPGPNAKGGLLVGGCLQTGHSRRRDDGAQEQRYHIAVAKGVSTAQVAGARAAWVRPGGRRGSHGVVWLSCWTGRPEVHTSLVKTGRDGRGGRAPASPLPPPRCCTPADPSDDLFAATREAER